MDLPLATYFMVAMALHQKEENVHRTLSRPEMAPALTDLQRRASSGSDRRALVLWGRVLMAQGKSKEAISAFEKAVEVDDFDVVIVKLEEMTEEEAAEKMRTAMKAREQASAEASQYTPPNEEAPKKSVAENDDIDDRVIPGTSMAMAYMHLAQHHLDRGDDHQAQLYFRVAAKIYDHAGAWLQLARFVGQPPDPPVVYVDDLAGPPQQLQELKESYLLAAAKQGKAEAAKKLAELYQDRSEGLLDTRRGLAAAEEQELGVNLHEDGPERDDRRQTDRMWAREWTDLVRAAKATGVGGVDDAAADEDPSAQHLAGIQLLAGRRTG